MSVVRVCSASAGRDMLEGTTKQVMGVLNNFRHSVCVPENFGFSCFNNKNSKYNPTCQFMCFEIQSTDCIKCPLGFYKI